jgi:tetratricopeptide (TPR) repeat protein/HEAT repeat protein
LVRGLVHFGDYSVGAMVELLKHEDSRIRAVAEEVLTKINTPHSQEVLDEYLEREPLHHLLARLTYGSTEVRQRAEREMAEMSGPELAELLAKTFGEKEGKAASNEGKALLRAMAELHFPEVVPQLLALATGPRTSVAKSAMTTLSAFPYVVNRPTLMAQLQDQRASEVRKAAKMLGQQDTTVVDDVLDHLSSSAPNMRAGALEVLGAKRARWAVDFVMPLFDDSHPRVRLALASNISKLSVPRLEDEIVSRLVAILDSASGELLTGLVSALQAMACGSGREDVHAGLVSAWKRQTSRGGQTLEAIGAVGHPEARRILLSQLDTGGTPALQSAVVGLTRLGDPSVFPALEGAFDKVTTTPLFRRLHEGLSRLSKGWHRLYRTQVALARGNPHAALAAIDGYGVDNPNDGMGHLERGRALHMAGEVSAAYDEYLRAGRRMGTYNVVWYAAALAAHQLGDLEAASKHYDQVLQARRDDSEARLRRGLLHLERQGYQAALADFQAVGRARDAASFHKRVANALSDVVTLYVDAPANTPPRQVQLLALMDRPLPNRLADLAVIWALILVGRFAVARQCLDRFAQRWPESSSYTLLNTAWLYAAAGEMARAQEALDDLRDDALKRGYHWVDFVHYAFSDWPVVCEPLTRMLLDIVGE